MSVPSPRPSFDRSRTGSLATALAAIAVEYERHAAGASPREARRLTLAAQAARVLLAIVSEVDREVDRNVDRPDVALHDVALRVDRFSAWITARAAEGDAAHALALCGVVSARLAA